VRILIFLLVSSTAHFLAARWIVSAFPAARTKRNKRILFSIAGVLSLFLAVVRLIGWKERGPTLHMTLAVGMIELTAVVITLGWLGLVVIASRAATHVITKIKPPVDDAAKEKLIGRREAIERTVGITLATASTAALGWGIVRGRHAFEIEEVVVKIPNWPRALEGYTIAQVSDVHVGAFVTDRELDEGFELVLRIKPDLVVATGDLVDFEFQKIDPLLRHLERTNPRDGIFTILGNHDHYAGAHELAEQIQRSTKVKLLTNENLHLRPNDGGGFALLGVDDLEGLRRRDPDHPGPDLDRALASVRPDLPRILLAHQPRFFDDAQGRVALQLSGHTHGGQINPGFRPASALMRYVAGRYERKGSTLWVNRGFGVSGPPARIGAPPEVTKIVIVAA
jgi:uncharacterized protein